MVQQGFLAEECCCRICESFSCEGLFRVQAHRPDDFLQCLDLADAGPRSDGQAGVGVDLTELFDS